MKPQVKETKADVSRAWNYRDDFISNICLLWFRRLPAFSLTVPSAPLKREQCRLPQMSSPRRSHPNTCSQQLDRRAAHYIWCGFLSLASWQLSTTSCGNSSLSSSFLVPSRATLTLYLSTRDNFLNHFTASEVRLCLQAAIRGLGFKNLQPEMQEAQITRLQPVVVWHSSWMFARRLCPSFPWGPQRDLGTGLPSISMRVRCLHKSSAS